MVSQEEYDGSRTAAEAAKAAVQADQAAVVSAHEAVRSAKAAIVDAQLRQEYCTIRSPIDGKTGSLLIDRGNLVRANDTTSLVTVNQIAPIYVTFTLPETNLSEVKRRMADGALPVQAFIPGEEDRPITGPLTFMDNAVNPTTGTIGFKATFENQDNRLWPGQFVNVAVQLDVLAQAIVAPARAIQTGQAGPFAYVVKPDDMTVEMRPVTTGEPYRDLVVVTDGLQPDEKVVTDGQMRLMPGAKVEMVAEPEAGGTSAQ
jgi:multidrug efflux system membrane fusion protein